MAGYENSFNSRTFQSAPRSLKYLRNDISTQIVKLIYESLRFSPQLFAHDLRTQWVFLWEDRKKEDFTIDLSYFYLTGDVFTNIL